MMTDSIADMLTRIRNAQMARKPSVEMPLSRVKKAIADILVREGYVQSVVVADGMPARMTLVLQYDAVGRGAIQSIDRKSKPGHRYYARSEELKSVLNGFGMAIVSTSKGIMTDKEAKKQNVGGEVLCEVWR